MNKLKSLIISILTVCCIFLNGVMADAYTPFSDVVVSLQIDNPIMEVNGAQKEIDVGHSTMPVVKNGRTLVPIRGIIEAFGGSVEWDSASRTVTLTLGEDIIKLTIDNNLAQLNGKVTTLDVAPAIIGNRTMLPVRFIAESFNLGVGWDSENRTVYIVSNSFDDAEYKALKAQIPDYRGEPYVYINSNQPFFKDYEIIECSFEFYASLDELGRCDVTMASVGKDLMPTEKRESISSVTPTGWINNYYDIIDGGYLYNRCHLIGFQLTGENANKRNLITGTRYLNIDGMLEFENMVDRYVENSGNNVMYRSTPVFSGNNLVADGVLLEAYSVEDRGQGISFCVYCYNVQPGVSINYATGENAIGKELIAPKENQEERVYRTPTGKRYHFDSECGGKNSYKVGLNEAENDGLTPCLKCIK